MGCALLVASASGVACSRDASSVTSTPLVTGSPAVVSANGVMAFIVGVVAAYDATKGGAAFTDPARDGLTYAITINAPANGLTSSGGTITGTPLVPGVTVATITVRDVSGRSASDQFAIVTFAAGLPSPTLPAALLPYADANGLIPAQFNATIDGVSVTGTDVRGSLNSITDAGATLGRVLFHDPRLSANDGTSCASCHIQSLGFADALPLSVGFAGARTARHTPALGNVRYYQRGRFFWDERAATLEAQVVGPIQNATEMGMTLDNLRPSRRRSPARSNSVSNSSAARGARPVTRPSRR